jgi:hypothetical protein
MLRTTHRIRSADLNTRALNKWNANLLSIEKHGEQEKMDEKQIGSSC